MNSLNAIVQHGQNDPERLLQCAGVHGYVYRGRDHVNVRLDFPNGCVWVLYLDGTAKGIRGPGFNQSIKRGKIMP